MSDRLTAQQIDQQIKDERTAHLNSVYPKPIPKGFVSLFRDAIFTMPPNDHQIHAAVIKSIIAKKEHELTFGEVGGMQNLIVRTPLSYLYPTIEDALKHYEQIEKLVIEYNMDNADYEKGLNKKRNSLTNLLDLNKSTDIRVVSR